MQALVKTKKGKNNIELKEVEEPSVTQSDTVLIEVKAAGVCGSDIHIKNDAHPYYPPVILGHEFSGEIVETGKNVNKFKIGDRVVAEPHTLACKKCYYCKQGKFHICPSKRPIGWGINGAFTKYIVMPENLLHKIPDKVSFREAAICEPSAVSIHATLERAKVKEDDFVVVFGPGPIGLLSAIAAKTKNAKVLIVGTKNDTMRLKTAEKLGIDFVLNIDKHKIKKRVDDLTDGVGADLVIESSGADSAILSSVDLIRRDGIIAAIGVSSNENIIFPWNKAIFKSEKIIFNFSSTSSSWEKALQFLSEKKINTDLLITHEDKLKNWKKVFKLVEEKKVIKALLIP